MARLTNISFNKEDVSLRLPNRDALLDWIKLIVRREGSRLGPLCFIYCSDPYLRKINCKYLKINIITDVIAFEYSEESGVSGDIYISVDRVRENARYYKVRFHTELSRVMVHGLLHLLGYRDKSASDKKLMTEREDLYLSLRPR